MCAGAILFAAAPVQGDAISGWQWNGFSRSSPPVTSKPATSAPQTSVTSLLTFSALAQPVVANDVGGTASLSGYVYFDVDPNDGIMGDTDWAIADAEIGLTQVGSSQPVPLAYTHTDGSYSFTGLAPGEYTITMLTPSSPSDQYCVPELLDKDGNKEYVGEPTTNAFSHITLDDGYVGRYYSFAELSYPIALISKRMMLNSSPRVIHTHSIPEPGTLVLLAMAGLFFGGLAWRRRGVRAE